jgi:phage terminase small subunit
VSPTIPLSRFVDEESLEPLVPQPGHRVEGRTDSGTVSPSDFAAQVRAHLEECEPLPPLDPVDAGRIPQETGSDGVTESQIHKRMINRHRGLSAKQQRFVDEYLVDLNATQAAIRAGYSERTARAIGCENLTKPDIKMKIQVRLREAEEKTGLDRVRILKGLMQIADSNIVQLFDQHGRLLPVEAWPEGIAPAVKSCRSVVTGTPGTQNHRRVTKIVLQDKVRALFTLLDYLAPRSDSRRSRR